MKNISDFNIQLLLNPTYVSIGTSCLKRVALKSSVKSYIAHIHIFPVDLDHL